MLAAILGALSVAVTLPNPLLRDDVPMIVENPVIRGAWMSRDVWLSDWWSAQAASAGRREDASRDRLYRPLVMFTLAAGHTLHGTWPAGHRMFNMAAHVACVVLLWRIAVELTGDRAAACASASLFAVHPVHVEAVAEVVGRADILAGMFVMLGVLLLARGGEMSIGRGLAAAVMFFLGLMSKETAVCYAPIAGMIAVIRPGGDRERGRRARRVMNWAVVLALPLLAHVPLRFAATGGLLAFAGPNEVANPLFAATGVERVVGVFTILGHYARLLAFPARLSGDYGLAVIDPRRGPDAMTVLGAATAVVLVATPVAWWMRRRRALPDGAAGSGAPTVLSASAGCVVAFACAYFPISNAGVLIGTAAAERLCYLASAPVALAAGVIVAETGRRMRARYKTHKAVAWQRASFAVVVVLLGVRSVARGREWRSEEALYGVDWAAQPRSVKTAVGLSRAWLLRADKAMSELERREALDRAECLLAGAILIAPQYAPAIRQQAIAAEMGGEIERAEGLYRQALRLDADDAVSARRLSELARFGRASRERATEARLRVARQPEDSAARVELANELMSRGDALEALAQYREAVRLEPANAEAYAGMGAALLVVGRTGEAVEPLRRSLELREGDHRVHGNLAMALAGSDSTASVRHARRAAELRPEDVDVQLNLAAALVRAGRSGEAVAALRSFSEKLAADDSRRAAIDAEIRRLERGVP